MLVLLFNVKFWVKYDKNWTLKIAQFGSNTGKAYWVG